MVKTILIDDELFALQYLEYQLSDIEGLQIIGKFKDPIAGKKAIETNDVDLVFLDIHIPLINGIELAELLLENKPDLQIVFITAHHDYAIRAFELNALDYVLKPVTK
ncbi:response regulator [Robertmurraya sp. DFI.2.37]|uniref:LytR/AlgR family response regulator transcription factor n=1 Tax=Robertmurraya sp. DFI.2.37 TaxID=3031819 RepID=UPI0023DA95F2|nr:response regulator [Robertmurraya sp. DFI.2.37]MDF1508984.1 response regulator [Robertmurraya sp. DFI.2.37]